MKTISIKIPDGKEAKWVDGVLTLVDEQPVEFRFNQLIKDFRKWREERKRVKELSQCRICKYYNNSKYNSFCCGCMNGIDDSYFTPTLRPVSATEFASIIIDNFLGKDWCVTDPLSKEQLLAIALEEILKKIKL